MNWEVVAGDRNHFKLKVKAEWDQITADDPETIADNRVALQQCIQQLSGLSEDEIERQVARFELPQQDRPSAELLTASRRVAREHRVHRRRGGAIEVFFKKDSA